MPQINSVFSCTRISNIATIYSTHINFKCIFHKSAQIN